MTETAIATTNILEDYDPLDDPEIRKLYDSIKTHQGQSAADRYLLTVTSKAMQPTSPAVVARDRSLEQKQGATKGAEPQGGGSTMDASTCDDSRSPTDETLASVETPAAPTLVVAVPIEATAEATTTSLVETPTTAEVVAEAPVETVTKTSVTVTVPLKDTPEIVLCQDEPVNTSMEAEQKDVASVAQPLVSRPTVTNVVQTKPQRKPPRSTAQVKQAFETALAEFVKADEPFKRTHVLRKAELSPNFYDTYPSLRQKVDQAIANVGKPKPQTGTPMTRETDATPTTEPVVATQAAEPGAEHTATSSDVAESGTLAKTDSTAVTDQHTTVAGLTWTDMEGLADHWKSEQVRLKQQISGLLTQLETAVANAEAYERVLELHSTKATGEDS